MATLSKNGAELARFEATRTHDDAEGYDAKTVRIILSYRDTGMVMRRVVSVSANGYKAPAVWRRYRKIKSGADIAAVVEKHTAQLTAAGWTKVN